MASSKSPRTSEDRISNLPDNVTDKILKCLPLSTVAKTSVLSKHWKHNWLSLPYLNFDEEFWYELENEDGSFEWEKCYNIISSVLLNHIGPIHDFQLYITDEASTKSLYLSQWLSFLSRNAVKNIMFDNGVESLLIPSYVYLCQELLKLDLKYCTLSPPPSGFKCFPYLQVLELVNVEFTRDIFGSLISNCPQLAKLRLEECIGKGMTHIVLNVPSLDHLTVKGVFKSLEFRNVRSLTYISLGIHETLETPLTIGTFDAITVLASSCELKNLHFSGYLCKFLAAGRIKSSLPVTYKHVQRLSLTEINLNDLGVFCFVIDMIHSCPCTEVLEIKINPSKDVVDCIFDSNDNSKLTHLLRVDIMGITGSSAELKLIEYVLAVSTVLEKMVLKGGKVGIESEPKMLRKLMGFPRASPKARLVCLKK